MIFFGQNNRFVPSKHVKKSERADGWFYCWIALLLNYLKNDEEGKKNNINKTVNQYSNKIIHLKLKSILKLGVCNEVVKLKSGLFAELLDLIKNVGFAYKFHINVVQKV